jgi:hypothetical protein
MWSFSTCGTFFQSFLLQFRIFFQFILKRFEISKREHGESLYKNVAANDFLVMGARCHIPNQI